MNKTIKEKLLILQKVGINNESNSLFKQIVQDIQNVTRNSMTRSDIVNCIKASSFGVMTVLEPKAFESHNVRNVIDVFKKNVHNSGEQSRGYSLY